LLKKKKKTLEVLIESKTVVADERVAFLGGIDLCFMRFDNRSFKITDPDETEFPGMFEAGLT